MTGSSVDAATSDRSRSEHRIDTGRVVAFSDGVFAIAITLIVLTIQVPNIPEGRMSELPQKLLDLWPQVFSYGLTFLVIGKFWLRHHRLFRAVANFDTGLTALNLLFLFLSLIVLLPFPTEVLGGVRGPAHRPYRVRRDKRKHRPGRFRDVEVCTPA